MAVCTHPRPTQGIRSDKGNCVIIDVYRAWERWKKKDSGFSVTTRPFYMFVVFDIPCDLGKWCFCSF